MNGMLKDVMIIRPLAIILLIFWHSFIIYTGGWKPPMSVGPVESYWWIARFSYSGMLELFVFISGYVFGISIQKGVPAKDIILKKFKRLIIPSICFSIIYYLIFMHNSHTTVWDIAIKIISGCGHMWFLPMLFWSTIISYTIYKIKCNTIIKIIGMAILPMVSSDYLPFGISTSFYYILFFYIGIITYNNRNIIQEKTHNKLIISALWGGVFAVIHCGFHYNKRYFA